MAEPRRQDWRVPQRTPAIAALATVALVAVMLLVAGRAYWHGMGLERHRPVTAFPAPGVETYIHDGQGDPPRPHPRPTADPAIEAAKRAVVADGLPGWPR